MKQCPACKTTYTDSTLSYCLADGTALIDVAGAQPVIGQGGAPISEETVFMQRGGDQMRVEIPQETAQTTAPPMYQPVSPPPSGSSGGLMKTLIVVLGLGIFVVLAVAVGTYIYFNRNVPERVYGVNNTDTKPSPSPAANEKDDLRDQIANLQKLINDQKKNNQPTNVPLTGTTTTAQVNSPGDGFLALRSLPSSSTGARILQIPHGATVTVGGCLNPNNTGNKPGRWCRASYNGYTGWVYDSFLIY